MKKFMVSKDIEIVNNLSAILSTLEMGDPDLAKQVKAAYDELAKKNGVIPFLILTNKKEVFPPSQVPQEGDFILLMVNPATRALLANLHISLSNKTIHRIVTEVS